MNNLIDKNDDVVSFGTGKTMQKTKSIKLNIFLHCLALVRGQAVEWTNGRQMSEVVSNETGETVLELLYDDNGILTQKTDYEGTTYYTNIDGNFTTQYLESKTGIPTEQMQFIYDDNNQVTALCFNTAMYYYVKNAMGDVIGIVNEDGKRVCTYEYDAWGNVLNTYHYDSTGIDYNVGERNPIRYRSYYFDNSIGFYYLQSRFYFSSMARFINADLPIYAQKQKDMNNGTNLFAYCNNDPVNYVDPDGRLRATLSYYKSQSWLFKFLSKYVGVVYDVERPFVKKGSEENVQITMSSIIGYSYGALGLVTLSVSNTTLKKSFMGVSFSTNTKGGVFVGASFSFMKTKVGSFIGIEGKHLCYGVSVAHNLKSNGSTYYVAFKLAVKINIKFLAKLTLIVSAAAILCKPIAVLKTIIKRIMKSPTAVGGATVTVLKALAGT